VLRAVTSFLRWTIRFEGEYDGGWAKRGNSNALEAEFWMNFGVLPGKNWSGIYSNKPLEKTIQCQGLLSKNSSKLDSTGDLPSSTLL
jgi:hypothetical protein